MSDDHEIKIDDREQMLSSGMRWLFEHEILNSTAAQEAIWMNVAMQSKAIKDTEPLIDQYHKKMLIYVDLKWWSFLVNKKELANKIINVIGQALPQYSMRVVYDRKILEKSIKLLEKIHGADEIG